MTGGPGRPDAAPGARAFLTPESAVTWEYDPPNEGDTAEIRWRTLVSADRTPHPASAARSSGRRRKRPERRRPRRAQPRRLRVPHRLGLPDHTFDEIEYRDTDDA